MLEELVVVLATRTPIGSFMGGLSKISATQLGFHNKKIV